MRLLRSLEAVEPHSLKGVIKFFFFQVLFEEQTEISFEVPYCKRNGEKMKKIICKVEEYVNYKIKFRYTQGKCYLQGTCTCKEFFIRNQT